MLKGEVGKTKCNLVRTCNTKQCVLNMMSNLNYKTRPTSEIDKKRNVEIERNLGKGVWPDFKFVGEDDNIHITCGLFSDKDRF